MTLRKIFNYVIFFLSIHLFMFTEWLHRYFGKVDFEQISIFFNFGVRGLLNTEEYVIEKYLELCLYFPLFILSIILLSSSIIKKKVKNLRIIYLLDKIIILNYFLFIISIIFLFQNLNLKQKIENLSYSDFIEKNYVPPKLTQIKKDKQKDLLVVYLESFNEEFTNFKNVTKKSKDFLNFKNLNTSKVNNYYETAYNNYTIGSIVSTSCGLPQKPIGILDTRFRERKGSHIVDVFGLKKFLPGAICLGDILKYNDYKNIFINSISPSFQAMDIFFRDHNYDTIIGKKYFKEKGYNDFTSWGKGVNDRILFEDTLKIIDKLKKKNQKFNITLLTTDSHYPGYFDNKCIENEKIVKKDLSFTINCTAKHLYNFINDLKKKYGESIIIIVVGDHLMPDTNKDDKNLSNKSIFNRFVNSNVKILRQEMNHYDLFSTILDLINYPYEGKIGLGYSVLRNYPEIDYNYYKNTLINNIEKKSNFYYEFWK